MDLQLRQQLVGAKLHTNDGIKTVESFEKYDSITHTFTIKFTNGDIQEVPDKDVFTVEVTDLAELKPNKKRVMKG